MTFLLTPVFALNIKMDQLGIVVIGRNEGDRLKRCLRSVVDQGHCVYVDSGSTDGSVAFAQSIGVDVIQLDLAIPFTAARARNAGFTHLHQIHPEIDYVQFIDGDCEMVSGWLIAASQVLEEKLDIVAVCGLRRERHPEKSLYNRICDLEWQLVIGSPGEVEHFGGEVMVRAEAFKAVGGYNNRVIAAEDDDLSVRLRLAGGELWCLDRICSLHDANMYQFRQWWQRAKRCGYAFAQVSSLHGKSPEKKFVKQIRSVWLHGLILPLVAITLTIPSHGLSLLLFCRYPLSAFKVAYQTHAMGFPWTDSFTWGASCSVSAFPAVLGTMQFYLNQLVSRDHQIIEYKTPDLSSN